MTGKTCFVVGPIGTQESDERIHSDWLLDGILRPAFAAQFPEYELIRADLISSPGMIDAQVIELLLSAPLVIADLTFLNANAFYEIGIRHLAQLPIVHMHQVGSKLPFDLSLFRSIEFSHHRPEDLRRAIAAVQAAVAAVLAPGYVIDNPVTRARGKVKFEETATPIDRILGDRLLSLTSAVERLTRESQGRNIDHVAPKHGDIGHLEIRPGATDEEHLADKAKLQQFATDLGQASVDVDVRQLPDGRLIVPFSGLTDHQVKLIEQMARAAGFQVSTGM